MYMCVRAACLALEVHVFVALLAVLAPTRSSLRRQLQQQHRVRRGQAAVGRLVLRVSESDAKEREGAARNSPCTTQGPARHGPWRR